MATVAASRMFSDFLSLEAFIFSHEKRENIAEKYLKMSKNANFQEKHVTILRLDLKSFSKITPPGYCTVKKLQLTSVNEKSSNYFCIKIRRFKRKSIEVNDVNNRIGIIDMKRIFMWLNLFLSCH